MNKIEISHKLFSEINQHNWEEVISLFDDEGSLVFPGTSPLSGSHLGKDAIRRYFRRMHLAVPDLQFQILNVAESEKIVVLEWRNRGETRKGVPYENKGVTVLEFKGEKILQLRDYLDTERLKPSGKQ